MATEAQRVANRLNAQRSTGPRTAAGKAVVAQNAVKHGLCARGAVIVGEDPGEFEFHRDRMLDELAPVGALESMLAERVARLSWRLQRAERIQDEAFVSLHTKQVANPLAKLTRSLRPRNDAGDDADTVLGRMVVADFAGSHVLDRLLLYERRIENSLYRTMTELQRLRLVRELQDSTETPKPAVRSGPARAYQEGTPDGVTTNGETKPIEADGGAENAVHREAQTDSAGQDQSSASRLLLSPARGRACCASGNDTEARGGDVVKQSQSAGSQTNREWEQGVWNRTRALQNKPNSRETERTPAPRPAKPGKTAVRIRRS